MKLATSHKDRPHGSKWIVLYWGEDGPGWRTICLGWDGFNRQLFLDICEVAILQIPARNWRTGRVTWPVYFSFSYLLRILRGRLG